MHISLEIISVAFQSVTLMIDVLVNLKCKLYVIFFLSFTVDTRITEKKNRKKVYWLNLLPINKGSTFSMVPFLCMHVLRAVIGCEVTVLCREYSAYTCQCFHFVIEDPSTNARGLFATSPCANFCNQHGLPTYTPWNWFNYRCQNLKH